MVALAIAGIDLFKIAGRSIAGWIPSFKTCATSHVRQPFCSQLEERRLLWLEYHPQVAEELHEELTGLAPKPDLARLEKTLEVGRSMSAIWEEGSPRPTA